MAMDDDDFEDDDELELFEDYEDGDIGYARFLQARGVDLTCAGCGTPFRGMPEWAQWIGSVLPNTHFLRIVRGILLKGNGPLEIAPEIWPLLLFLVVAMAIGVKRYRQTLD